jgi:class 3 adenylate cyclase
MLKNLPISNSASGDRLEKLIAERLADGADKNEIEARIWNLFGEEWAIMFTDLSGFSRFVASFGIVHFLQVIYESQRLLVPCIDNFDGIMLKQDGDSMLTIFRRPQLAVECAISMQRIANEYNRGMPEEEQIILCIGVGFGDVLRIGDSDVFGAEVNAAAKLGEDIARGNEILITESVYKSAQSVPGITFKQIPEIPPGANGAYQLVYSL